MFQNSALTDFNSVSVVEWNGVFHNGIHATSDYFIIEILSTKELLVSINIPVTLKYEAAFYMKIQRPQHDWNENLIPHETTIICIWLISFIGLDLHYWSFIAVKH